MQEQMEQIDVEAIMQGIRKQIEERGYRKSDLHFADIAGVTAEGVAGQSFAEEDFSSMVDLMNARGQISCDGIIQGNRIAVFIKRAIRKMIRFYIWPIVNDQNFFNSCATSAMTQLREKLEEERKEKEELTLRLDELEERIRELEEKASGQAKEKCTEQLDESCGGCR